MLKPEGAAKPKADSKHSSSLQGPWEDNDPNNIEVPTVARGPHCGLRVRVGQHGWDGLHIPPPRWNVSLGAVVGLCKLKDNSRHH